MGRDWHRRFTRRLLALLVLTLAIGSPGLLATTSMAASEEPTLVAMNNTFVHVAISVNGGAYLPTDGADPGPSFNICAGTRFDLRVDIGASWPAGNDLLVYRDGAGPMPAFVGVVSSSPAGLTASDNGDNGVQVTGLSAGNQIVLRFVSNGPVHMVVGRLGADLTEKAQFNIVCGVIPTPTPTATPVPTPTPTPTTGQGCTPGYWKARQHFDSWPASYAPATLFSTAFGQALPGQNGSLTMIQALNLGGSGFEGLGRHGTAALLNANTPGVNYGLTSDQVIDLVNDAIDSNDPAVATATMNRLGALNDRSCPLN